MTITSLSATLGELWTPVQVADLIVVLTDNGDNCSLAPSTHLSVTQDSLRPTSGLGLPRGCPPPRSSASSNAVWGGLRSPPKQIMALSLFFLCSPNNNAHDSFSAIVSLAQFPGL